MQAGKRSRVESPTLEGEEPPTLEGEESPTLEDEEVRNELDTSCTDSPADAESLQHEHSEPLSDHEFDS